VTAGVALVLKLLGILNGTTFSRAGAMHATSFEKAADMISPLAASSAGGAASEGARLMATAMPEAANGAANATAATVSPPVAHTGFLLWLSNDVILAFLVGGLFALLMFALFSRRNSR